MMESIKKKKQSPTDRKILVIMRRFYTLLFPLACVGFMLYNAYHGNDMLVIFYSLIVCFCLFILEIQAINDTLAKRPPPTCYVGMKKVDAAKPDIDLAHELGMMHDLGLVCPQDDKKAFEWYEKAANQGDVKAQFVLGFMYAMGYGTAQDYKKARYWYKKAATQGYARSKFNLGVLYYYGQGVPKDDKQAVLWWKKAAEQGNPSAQFALGWMYYHGQGVPKDDKQARYWYQKAAKQGDSDAQKNLELIKGE